MEEILISPHVVLRIFKYIDPLVVFKFRAVNIELKKLIDSSEIWRRLIVETEEISPWRIQLIELKFPFKKNSEYDNLSDKECRELVEIFIKWRMAHQNSYVITETDVFNQTINSEENVLCEMKFDFDGNYCVIYNEDNFFIYIYDLRTGTTVLGPVNIFEYIPVSGVIFGRNRMRPFAFWAPDENKIFVIIQHPSESNFIIFDIKERRRLSTPRLIIQAFQRGTCLLRPWPKFSNHIYVLFKRINESEVYDIVRLKWDSVEQNLSADFVIVFTIQNYPNPEMGHITWMDFKLYNSLILFRYTNERTVMLHQYTVPEQIKRPIEFDYCRGESLFARSQHLIYHVCKIHSPDVFTSYIPGSKYLSVVIKVKNHLNQDIFRDKEYRLEISEDDQIQNVEVFLNNLYIFFKKGLIKIYKLKNLSDLLHMNFQNPPDLEIQTNITYWERPLFFALKDNQPCIISFEKPGIIQTIQFLEV